jgi:hypothetical protein
MHHDGMGYYMYLPHVVIYHSFDLQPGEDMTGYGPVPGSRKIFDKYSYGTAVMMMPFFLVAHAVAYLTNSSPDGFSKFYDIGVMMAAVFYLVFGMFFLIRALSPFFSPLVLILALLGIYGGTNLYFYTIRDPAYSHVYSFFLFCILIYLTPGFIENTTWKRSIFFAIIFGWIFLIRPTNGVVILYPLLYNIYSLNDLKQRLNWIKVNLIKLCVLPLAAILWFIPQLLYWHSVLGRWQLYAYRHEGFIYWDKPKIFHVLFSVQNGVVIYAPITIFVAIGLLMGIIRKKISAPAIVLILAISTYIFASWWCWWYGGAYGHRGYIEYYAFMSIPIAYSLLHIIRSRSWMRYAGVFLFLLCIFYSMQMNYAYSWPWEGPGWTWHSYGRVVMKVFGMK